MNFYKKLSEFRSRNDGYKYQVAFCIGVVIVILFLISQNFILISLGLGMLIGVFFLNDDYPNNTTLRFMLMILSMIVALLLIPFGTSWEMMKTYPMISVTLVVIGIPLIAVLTVLIYSLINLFLRSVRLFNYKKFKGVSKNSRRLYKDASKLNDGYLKNLLCRNILDYDVPVECNEDIYILIEAIPLVYTVDNKLDVERKINQVFSNIKSNEVSNRTETLDELLSKIK